VSLNNKKKTCYICLSDDILSKSNFELINKASKYGNVIIGLMSDKAIIEYKSYPLLNYTQRNILTQNLKNVHKVIEQKNRDYTDNLKILKPDYVIHKKNKWTIGIQKEIRKKIIKTIKTWSGKLIELDIKIDEEDTFFEFNSNFRKNKLKRLINSKEIVRCLEAHNSLSGLIIEKLKVKKNNKIDEFDAMWCSSLADSAIRGKPDNQSVDLSIRINALNDILETTSKPIIFDADNGGATDQLPFTIKNLERMGISAVVLEDKVGVKKNSLFDNQNDAKQDTIKNFSKKLSIASKARNSKELLIVARIESFILGKGLNDALKRANSYSKAGADMILIHSKDKTPKEIFKFSKVFKKSKYYKPMICVPSTYSNTHEKLLIKKGFKVVIYANQLLRSIYPAMVNTAKSILINKKSKKIENKISSVKDIISLIS
jgi:phosphoenolpyruvate phosphomutase / 2-hydroxyethylphosphonate cytidylyltransferase